MSLQNRKTMLWVPSQQLPSSRGGAADGKTPSFGRGEVLPLSSSSHPHLWNLQRNQSEGKQFGKMSQVGGSLDKTLRCLGAQAHSGRGPHLRRVAPRPL